MIDDLIIQNVPRDLNGLNQCLEHAEYPETTKLPGNLYIFENKPGKIKDAILTSILVSAVAAIIPDFSKVNFHNDLTKKGIIEYCKYVDSSIQSTLEEYEMIFKNSFSHEDFIKEVLSFEGLQNNWDGYGAIPTEVQCASKAISLANKLSEKIIAKISEIFPNPNGTVTVEWENYSGERLVAEIGKRSFSYYLKLNSLDPKFYNDVPVSDEGIYELSSNIKKLFI